MFSNTANNSASDKVKTRPKLNAYLVFIDFIKNNQQKIALAIGYFLVAAMFYGLGLYNAPRNPPSISVQEPTFEYSQVYNTLLQLQTQLVAGQGPASVAGAQTSQDTELNCEGKIKGNISSSSKIYHLPGGAFYKRTTPEVCFATEAEAQAAGFRKSKR